MIKDLGFCKMKFYKNYVTCIIYEGETISIKKSDLQTREILNYYDNTPFVYITHRVHSYAVDPAIYKDTSIIENLIGFAVVSEKPAAIMNANIEQLFLKKPFKTFGNLDDAKAWADGLIEEGLQLK